MHNRPLVSSLDPVLRCPNRRCKKFASRTVLPEGGLECEHCGAHWWAFRIAAGDVRSQLVTEFSFDESFTDIWMAMLKLPPRLKQPMYCQILLLGNHWHHFVTDRERTIRERSRELIWKIVHLYRRAS